MAVLPFFCLAVRDTPENIPGMVSHYFTIFTNCITLYLIFQYIYPTNSADLSVFIRYNDMIETKAKGPTLHMDHKAFSYRLSQLRQQKNISARDMSLSLGQNPGYINTIENGKAYPTMANFFYICEYLNVTPQEFFDSKIQCPEKLCNLLLLAKRLSDSQLDALTRVAEEFAKAPR